MPVGYKQIIARPLGHRLRSYNRPAFSVVDENQAGPLMVPAYHNVRATGGAVKSLARSIFDRLLPAGRKNDWREI